MNAITCGAPWCDGDCASTGTPHLFAEYGETFSFEQDPEYRAAAEFRRKIATIEYPRHAARGFDLCAEEDLFSEVIEEFAIAQEFSFAEAFLAACEVVLDRCNGDPGC
jgi:hypothetical protein